MSAARRFHDLAHALCYVVHLVLRHGRIEWQRHNSWIETQRARTCILRKRQSREEPMEGNRNEVDAGTDASFPQLEYELGPVYFESLQIQAKNVQVPGVAAAVVLRRKLYLV